MTNSNWHEGSLQTRMSALRNGGRNACDAAHRGKAATEVFGVRREAKRHAALAALDPIRKAVSPLRSATALQNQRGLE